MEQYATSEDTDGIRFSWRSWPINKVEATKIVVPVGCLYTPLKNIPTMPPPLQYQPVRCKGLTCNAILNPYCSIDYASKIWSCPFCGQRNHFPPHYSDKISETNLPLELIPNYTTIEYELPLTTGLLYPPIFLFVVDISSESEQLESLKDSLLQSLVDIPDNALIGLITYGNHIYVHELTNKPIPCSYAFRGNKLYEYNVIQEMLGLTLRHTADSGSNPAFKFLQTKSQCEYVFEKLLNNISRDPWSCADARRPGRCVGNAINIAESLLEACIHSQPARILCFTSGPCTIGPGMIVSTDLSDNIRGNTDIKKGNAKYLKEAKAYYKGILERLVKNKHTLDLFGACLDQIGLHEMEQIIHQTGGNIIMADSFQVSIFKESFHKMLQPLGPDYPQHLSQFLSMGFGGIMEVMTTKEYQVNGCIGPCYSLHKKSNSVSENVLGEGETCEWYTGCISPSTTFALYFDIVNPPTSTLTMNNHPYLQISSTYIFSDGTIRLRASTLCLNWNTDNNLLHFISNFDQETSAVLMARLAAVRAREDEIPDILRWLDRSLIRLVSKFADFRPNEPSSLKLPNEFLLYPQFMFHLRRSQFFEGINCSPDETVYYRMILTSQTCQNALVMIQPALLSYTFQGTAVPVILDITSVRPDGILLLDTYFYVVIFHGNTIAQWREAGYQDQPEHVAFRSLLELPQQHAQEIISGRFPIPRYILCDEGQSQSRFLVAKLNPSITHRSHESSHAQIFTDDVSLSVFMEHLWKVSVEQ